MSARRVPRYLLLLLVALQLITACGQPHNPTPEFEEPASDQNRTTRSPAEAVAPSVGDVTQSSGIAIEPLIDWQMEDRFGTSVDLNNNGRIDVPNSQAYVNNLPSWRPSCPESTLDRPLFKVKFDATNSLVFSLSQSDLADEANTPQDVEITNYNWQFSMREEGDYWSGAGPQPTWELCLPEGTYDLSLTIDATDGFTTNSATGSIVVSIQDFLIVSMGDSYASGEGNPEKHVTEPDRAYWADDGTAQSDNDFEDTNFCLDCDESNTGYIGGTPHVVASSLQNQYHIRSHRSTFAAPAQVALSLENADPHTSVTFVFLAQSGATIYNGLIGPYDGAVDVYPSADAMKSQVDQLKDLIGNRPVDALLLSAGGNDVGFANAVQSLIIREENGDYLPFPLIAESIEDGYWTRVEDQENVLVQLAELTGLINVPWPDNLTGLRGLYDAYKNFRARLNDERIYPFNVYITEYPAPLYKLSDGELIYCNPVLTELADTRKLGINWIDREINTTELAWIDENLLTPLNDNIYQNAHQLGWIPVLVNSNDSLPHGLCNESPYGVNTGSYPNTPSNIAPSGPTARWFRRAKEAAWIQGPGDDPASTKGVIHPNEYGHQWVAQRILSSLVLPVEVPGIGSEDRDDQIVEALQIRAFPASGNVSYTDPYTSIYPWTDVDLYRLYVSGNERFRVSVKSEEGSDARFSIRLFNQYGSEIYPNDPDICQREEAIPLSAQQPAQSIIQQDAPDLDQAAYTIQDSGIYFIGISALGNDLYDPSTGWGKANPAHEVSGDRFAPPGLYSLNVEADSFDPDSTVFCANVPDSDLWEGHAIETGLDVDLFKIDVAGGESRGFFVSTTFDAGGNPIFPDPAPDQMQGDWLRSSLQPQLRLFDASGTLLRTTGKELHYTFEQPGAYYLGVSSEGRSDYDPGTFDPEGYDQSGAQTAGAALDAAIGALATEPGQTVGPYAVSSQVE